MDDTPYLCLMAGRDLKVGRYFLDQLNFKLLKLVHYIIMVCSIGSVQKKICRDLGTDTQLVAMA